MGSTRTIGGEDLRRYAEQSACPLHERGGRVYYTGEHDVDVSRAWAEVRCARCDRVFTEVFALSHLEVHDDAVNRYRRRGVHCECGDFLDGVESCDVYEADAAAAAPALTTGAEHARLTAITCTERGVHEAADEARKDMERMLELAEKLKGFAGRQPIVVGDAG